jgi:hypothetical protein
MNSVAENRLVNGGQHFYESMTIVDDFDHTQSSNHF